MYDAGSRAGAGELRVLAEGEEPVLFHEGPVGNQLVPQREDKWMALLRRRTLLQDGGRAAKDDKPVRRALSTGFRTFDAAEELTTHLSLRRSFGYRGKEVRSEDRQELADAGEEQTSMSSRSDSGSFEPPA